MHTRASCSGQGGLGSGFGRGGPRSTHRMARLGSGRDAWRSSGLVRASRGRRPEGQGPGAAWRSSGQCRGAGSPGSVPGESRRERETRWRCRESTAAAGDGPPRGGRISPPSWVRGRNPGLAMPGRARRGQAQHEERGSPYKAVPHRVTPIQQGEGRTARGAACLGADGTLSPNGDPGHRGRERWQATAKGGEDPTRRGLAGQPCSLPREPWGAWGHPV